MIIYKITNLVNGKIYIGQTIKNLELRFYQHSFLAKNTKNSLITRSILKYGKENFKIEVIEECNDIDQLNDREIYWIDKLSSLHPLGYNLSKGGGNKEGFSKATLEKMSKHAVTRNRSRESLKNSTSNYKGVSWSNAYKQWVSQIKVGKSCKYLGNFNDETLAAKEYDLFCVKNNLNDCYLNFEDLREFYKNLPDDFTFRPKTKMQMDLIGNVYSNLKVVEFLGSLPLQNGDKNKFWLCECVCGNRIEVITSKLRAGTKKNCGCLNVKR